LGVAMVWWWRVGDHLAVTMTRSFLTRCRPGEPAATSPRSPRRPVHLAALSTSDDRPALTDGRRPWRVALAAGPMVIRPLCRSASAVSLFADDGPAAAHDASPRRLSDRHGLRGSFLDRDGFAVEASAGQEVGQGFAVLVAGQPDLAPVRVVDFRVVPAQGPAGIGSAVLGRTPERLIGGHGTSLSDRRTCTDRAGLPPRIASSRPRWYAEPSTVSPVDARSPSGTRPRSAAGHRKGRPSAWDGHRMPGAAIERGSAGEGAPVDHGRPYDECLLSKTKISYMYAPGSGGGPQWSRGIQ
jgi:hypothetical protein